MGEAPEGGHGGIGGRGNRGLGGDDRGIGEGAMEA